MLEQITVARYLEQRIALSGKSQKAIAAECGYANPNIITMFKNGATRLPFPKVAVMARALEVDPKELLRLVLSDYNPEALDMLDEVLGNASILSQDEASLLALARAAGMGRIPRLEDAANRERLTELIAEIAEMEDARDTASVARLDAMPRNARHR